MVFQLTSFCLLFPLITVRKVDLLYRSMNSSHRPSLTLIQSQERWSSLHVEGTDLSDICPQMDSTYVWMSWCFPSVIMKVFKSTFNRSSRGPSWIMQGVWGWAALLESWLTSITANFHLLPKTNKKGWNRRETHEHQTNKVNQKKLEVCRSRGWKRMEKSPKPR